MGKISIAFRGWRFDEAEVFDENGDFRPLDEMSEDTRDRLIRLTVLNDKACDACHLELGDDVDQGNVPGAVYGEPYDEVLLCREHENDFYYWYLEAGGDRYAGTDEFRDRFHEWFVDGGRAPDGYAGIEHVETEPEDLPDPRTLDPDDIMVEMPENESRKINLKDVDLDAEYPS